MGCGIAVATRLCISTESCIYLHRRRIAFPIKGAPPERTFKSTIIHPSYHTSTYLRAHQQAYLIRGTECTGQEVTDIKGSEYLLAHYHLLAHTTLLAPHTPFPISSYAVYWLYVWGIISWDILCITIKGNSPSPTLTGGVIIKQSIEKRIYSIFYQNIWIHSWDWNNNPQDWDPGY